MSDTREIIYNSPSMGRVTLLRTDEPVWFRGTTLEALESELSRRAAKDARVAVFYLYATDFDAIAAELEGRAKDWKNTAQPLDAFRREYLGVFSADTIHSNDAIDAMRYAREGLDKLARRDAAMGLTDSELCDEWRRRFPASRLLVCHATDDQLRAECERRRLDHAGIPDQWPVVKALKADVARLTKENRDLRNDHARLMMELAGSASVETGPGVVGVEAEKDTAHYVDPVDLLCKDEDE